MRWLRRRSNLAPTEYHVGRLPGGNDEQDGSCPAMITEVRGYSSVMAVTVFSVVVVVLEVAAVVGGDWNFNRFGEGENWDEPSSLQDPAFDFVYRVLSWIMLSNCLHFAVKKIVRIIADGSIVDSDREKVPARLAPIC